MTAFLVTNGTYPETIKKLTGKHEPTQLYVTLPAPNEEMYKDICSPLLKDSWNLIMQTLSQLKDFKCNTVIRLTLAIGVNMLNPDEYGKIIKKYQPKYVECKAYMHVGFSKERLGIEAMPRHPEIKEFSEKLAKATGYKIINEKKESRVVLLGK